MYTPDSDWCLILVYLGLLLCVPYLKTNRIYLFVPTFKDGFAMIENYILL